MRNYFWVISVGLIIGGIIAMYNLIVAKKPELKEKLEMIMPYSGYIGSVLLLAGIWGFVDGLVFSKFYLHIGLWLKIVPIQGIAILLFPPVCVLLGLLQGLPKIAEWTGKDLSKVENVAKKLAPFTAIIGIVGIVVGLLLVLFLLGINF